MNIIDIKKEEVEKALKEINAENTFDLLSKISQKYQQEYKGKEIDINTREGQTEFRRISCYLIEELMEMQNLLKIREWSKTEYPVDEVHLAEEFADFFNFVFQIPLLLGYNEEKIQDIVVRKYLINLFRKESHY